MFEKQRDAAQGATNQIQGELNALEQSHEQEIQDNQQIKLDLIQQSTKNDQLNTENKQLSNSIARFIKHEQKLMTRKSRMLSVYYIFVCV